MLEQYKIITDPFSGSVALSAIFASLSLIALFILLGVVRMKAWLAGLISLAIALVVAVIVYSMPLGQALLSASEGAAFGFFPILWIVINAIWVYNLTVTSGHFDVLRRSFERVSPDLRIQAIIIAFCFGALLEALAGFGTPVAITVVMLMALGFRPVHAASVALIANTAPVAFGALAAPITTLATVTHGASDHPGLTLDNLGAMVGRQTPVLAIIVPLVLVAVVDGKRGVRQTWPAAVLAGVTFAIAQFVAANYISVPLTDIVASLVSAAAVVLLLRVWRPSESPDLRASQDAVGDGSAAAAGTVDGDTTVSATTTRPGTSTSTVERVEARPLDSRADAVRAYAPYAIIIALFSIANLGAVKTALAKEPWTVKFQWPGLDVLTAAGKPQSSMTFVLNWLPAAGTLMIIAGILTAVVLGVRPGAALRAYAKTWVDLRHAIVTVMAVLALAYVLNQSGQTNTLGAFFAGTGGAFVFLSSILGWIGVAVTGSDTSANALFGALQVQTATRAGLDPVLLAAANSSGGVLGKMISPQNLAIAAAAVGMAGREGEIFRKVVGWSLVLLLFMCVLVTLQSTPILDWMVVK
ncbi:L-lactate permease [Planosporangium flavigriseum]|uniref:L-lactate permease n=1 Tax=Planosporangium flavigriseum TaxID=373681 RepID=A0A8J3PJA1_9ACTN|nr:L-lactate permease [Planosporangium flavigriseum]NJC64985.1 L-lactate permease [Planosporangium flavigriseum]GIG71597.1 L-lactate permease [Planosporangium flavigriseum]